MYPHTRCIKKNTPQAAANTQPINFQFHTIQAPSWQQNPVIQHSMSPKHLAFALRRLGRHKLTTTINILGLTFGLLSCLVIYLFVSFELSYDNFHPQKERIYRPPHRDQQARRLAR